MNNKPEGFSVGSIIQQPGEAKVSVKKESFKEVGAVFPLMVIMQSHLPKEHISADKCLNYPPCVLVCVSTCLSSTESEDGTVCGR